MTKLYTCDQTGAIGFDFGGVFVTVPFISECGRFAVNPRKYYGLTSEQIELLGGVSELQEGGKND